eukprot:TRINITY_DN3732_c0_g2_i1.p1 TRINITY_DN3732_c0_g2~~TRINITY_DN3732_c0_g2_i1.p1  ORF type:complete len:501 (-),score=213.87 TRINITY_DN3732_c0_g2_i1:806-2269(-)
MEDGGKEIDGIILVSLRDIGCDIGEEVKNVGQLEPDTYLQAVVLALGAIDEKKKFPLPLPRNMSQKVNVCSEIAKSIKELGFKGEVSYHHLLYPNEIDTRRLLIFLVENIPRDSSGGAEPTTSNNLVQTSILNKLEAIQKGSTSVPLPSNRMFNLHTSHIYSPFFPLGRNKGLDAYLRDLPIISQQVEYREDVAPSILEFSEYLFIEQQEKEREWSESGLKPSEYQKNKQAQINKLMNEFMKIAVTTKMDQDLLNNSKGSRAPPSMKRSRFMHQVEFAKKDIVSTKPVKVVKETEQEQEERREKEKADLDALLQKLIAQNEKIATESEKINYTIKQLEEQLRAAAEKTEALNQEKAVKERTYGLLPDADNNIRRLEELAQKGAQSIIELAAEWEKRRVPLIDEIRALKLGLAAKNDVVKVKLEQIKEMRKQMKEMAEEVQKKDERYKQLLEIQEKLPKEMNRAVYTRRILEIVKNVKKQKVDINKAT